MCRGDEDRVVEVGLVGQLVQQLGELALRRREAHVDDVEPLLDRPAQALEQDRAAALEAGAEHARAVEVALGREAADDAGAGRAVAAEVALGVVHALDLLVLAAVEGDRAVDVADLRVARLDPAVEDADAARPCRSPRRRPSRA